MAIPSECIRVVLVSPSDVARERVAAKRVIDELNGTVARDRLVLWRWETDARPGLHREGPQGLIDELMDMPSADIVIGIFWKRFGTATHEADSGTEHELRNAWTAWREGGRPEVMVYFSKRPYAPESEEELEQWQRVLRFRGELPGEQLWWTYTRIAEFERLLRAHLTRYLDRDQSVFSRGASGTPLARVIGGPAHSRASGARPGVATELRFNVPLPNRHFIGRSDELTALADALEGQRDRPAISSICGLGGVGKSQLATRYLHAAIDRYAVVAWIRCDEGGLPDLARFAEQLGEPVKGRLVPEQAALAVRWLAHSGDPWLLVLDNVSALEQLRDCCPASGAGHVIITTRDHRVARIGQQLTMRIFSQDDAVKFLLTRSGQNDEQEAARDLAKALGWLPLALAHAGAYCADATSLTEYREMLLDLPSAELFDSSPELSYDQTVATTWQVSIEAAAKRARLAPTVLAMVAHLGADAIPRSVFSILANDGDARARRDARDAIQALADFSLLEVQRSTVSAHRLLQRTVYESYAGRGDHGPALLALDAVLAIFPKDPPPERWIECRDLAPHALAVAGAIPAGHHRATEVVAFLNSICDVLNQAERGGALAFSQATLAHAERLVGEFSPDRLVARSGVATARYWIGELDVVIALEEQILEDCKAHLRTDDVEQLLQTIEAAANLADSYRTRGDYHLAIPIQESVVAERETLLRIEPPHKMILTARDRLAVSYRDAGRVPEAISLLERVIADSARTLGATDPETVVARANLASCHAARGDMLEAIAGWREVLQQRESRLPTNHPATLAARESLADALRAAWEIDEADEILTRLRADHEEILAPEHHATQRVRRRLRELAAGLLVRPATAQDVQALASIKYAREDELYQGYGSAEEHRAGLREFCSPEFIDGLLTDNKTILLAAQDRAQLQGLGAITTHTDHTWLHALYTRRSRGGIGTATLDALIEVARDRRYPQLRCGIFEPNAAARDFFERNGFVAVGKLASETYSETDLIEYRYAIDG